MSHIDDVVHHPADPTGGETAPVSESSGGRAVKRTPHLALSYAAFLRELPVLLAEHPGKWVAFTGDRQFGVDASKRALLGRCIAAGLHDGDFLICGIEPPQNVVLDDLMDV